MKHVLLAFWPALIALMLWLSGCDRPVNFERSGALGFSEVNDSIIFDTIFTTVNSPTERLFIYNRSGHNVEVSNIRIAGGDDSPFKLILDGVTGQTHDNVRIAKGDSMYAFFSMKKTIPPGADEDVVDQFLLTVGETHYKLIIYARVLDAHIMRDTVLPCDYTMPVDKPVLVDGYLYVDTNCTCRIPAGAKLYFTPRKDDRYNFFSQIYVDGTLLVGGDGVGGPQVLFTNFRLNKDYQEYAGQWQGIRFSQISKGNVINNALIKNGSNGVEVREYDRSGSQEPKLLIKNTEIRNMTNYGILAFGTNKTPLVAPMIQGYNLLVHSTGQSCVGLVGGGKYDFTHCTFYNNRNITTSRTEPVFGMNNYLKYYTKEGKDSVTTAYQGELKIRNCIVWGTNDVEISFDKHPNGELQTLVGYNLIRFAPRDTTTDFAKDMKTRLTALPNDLNFDPRFKDVYKDDFHLLEESPARDKGYPGIPAEMNDDLAGKSRVDDAAPDIGCYEYQPKN